MEILEVPKTLKQLEKEGAVIELKAVFKQAGAFRTSPVKDPDRPGFYLGVEKLSEEDKKGRSYYVDPEKLTIKVVNNMKFNLSDEVDRTNWAWLKHSPHIAMSEDEAQHTPYTWFFVHIQERETQAKVSFMELKITASNMIMNDDPINYLSRARLLGVDMRGQKAGEIKEYLLTEAFKSPKKVISGYDDASIGIKLIVLNALDANIIDFDGKVYAYNAMSLGMSEDAVVDYMSLSRNKQVLELIQRDLKGAGFKQTKIPEIEVAEEVSEPLPKQKRRVTT